MPEPEIFAAGAVPWRHGPAGLEVALIHRPKYDDWTFPKGKLESGEHVLRAACREVYEETGMRPILGRRLPARYYHKSGRLKRVDYWAATVAPGEHPEDLPGDEVDRLEWLTVPIAARRLSYDRDVSLLDEFAAGPPATTPYVILRHAWAGVKRTWADDDVLRPLDNRGRAQAAELAAMLSSFGRATVLSSPTARCIETVLPYAGRAGVEIKTESPFAVGGAKPGQAEDRLSELLTRSIPLVLCTHGELIPGLVERACGELGAVPPEDPVLPKGGFHVLHVAGGRLASIEHHLADGEGVS